LGAGTGYWRRLTGKRGLAVAKEYAGPIDLLLTDLVMPGINSKRLAREFKKVRPKAATMYMSGFTEREWGEAGTAGAVRRSSCLNLLPITYFWTRRTRCWRRAILPVAVSDDRFPVEVGAKYGIASVLSRNGNEPNTVVQKTLPKRNLDCKL
jgi:hypothetical protein